MDGNKKKPRANLDNVPQEIVDNVARNLDRASIVALFNTSHNVRALFEAAFLRHVQITGGKERHKFIEFLKKEVDGSEQVNDVAYSMEMVKGVDFHKREYIRKVDLVFGQAERNVRSMFDGVGGMNKNQTHPFRSFNQGPPEIRPRGAPTRMLLYEDSNTSIETKLDICQYVQLVARAIPKAEIRLVLISDHNHFRGREIEGHVHAFPNVTELFVEDTGRAKFSYFWNPRDYRDKRASSCLGIGFAESLFADDDPNLIAGRRTIFEWPDTLDFLFKNVRKYPNLKKITLHTVNRPYIVPLSNGSSRTKMIGSTDWGYLEFYFRDLNDWPPRCLDALTIIGMDTVTRLPILLHQPSMSYLRKLTLKDCNIPKPDLEILLARIPSLMPSCKEFHFFERDPSKLEKTFGYESCVCDSLGLLAAQMYKCNIMMYRFCPALMVKLTTKIVIDLALKAAVYGYHRDVNREYKMVTLNGFCVTAEWARHKKQGLAQSHFAQCTSGIHVVEELQNLIAGRVLPHLNFTYGFKECVADRDRRWKTNVACYQICDSGRVSLDLDTVIKSMRMDVGEEE